MTTVRRVLAVLGLALTVVVGSSIPASSFVCRPRRMRSTIKLRSYSATAPRICRSNWSCGVSVMGRSKNSTWQP